ncbi:hypothetical protein DFH08DRAFT_814620 [Mycena albidolilacea]|uniref:Uncharacterized protein n=1 Tax=Mycena albidolilacea TaxID=1033008 RepID=A0AAD6ZNH4_9AGAR|nr:hypothetical protein DFH08DRAFT_814620 [Mycena albidolilacea]
MDAANDPVHVFLMEAHNICVQAQFVVDSLPNSSDWAGPVGLGDLGQTGTFFLGSINFNAFEGHRGALVGIVNANSEGCGETVVDAGKSKVEFRKYWFGKALETHLSAGSGKYLQGKLWKRIWCGVWKVPFWESSGNTIAC